MPKNKKVPMRMCIACREMNPKAEMTRVVKSADGEICLDVTGKAPGRGAYICKKGDCFEITKKKRQLEKSFKCSISPEIYSMIEESLE